MEQPGSAVSEIKPKAKQAAPPPEMEVKGIKLEILLKADCASRRDSRYAGKEAKDQQRLLAVVPVQPNVDSVVVHDDGGQRSNPCVSDRTLACPCCVHLGVVPPTALWSCKGSH